MQNEFGAKTLWFGDHCFEIAGLGRGWMVQTDSGACWFGRGPTGLLLGPFHSKDGCGEAVQSEVQEWMGARQVEWKCTPENRAKDLIWRAYREERFSAELEFPVYEIAGGGIEPFCVVWTPTGVREHYVGPDAAEASNEAVQAAREWANR